MTRYSSYSGTGAFEISSLPGQSQVAVTHAFVVPFGQRGLGLGHKLKAQQNTLLKELHYDYALCTVSDANVAQKRVLEKAGWQRLTAFHNSRSDEVTAIYGYGVGSTGSEMAQKELDAGMKGSPPCLA